MPAERGNQSRGGSASGRAERQPKRTERLQLMLDDEELRAIDVWRFDNRIPSRAAAMRELIRRGMLYSETSDPEPVGAAGTKSTEFRAIPDGLTD